MVKFFFYGNFANIELIKKINNNFEIYDAYIVVKHYNKENNILEISDNNIENNTLLYGKIVIFSIKLENIIEKINNITMNLLKVLNVDKELFYGEQSSKENTMNLSNGVKTIYASKIKGGVYKTFIIY